MWFTVFKKKIKSGYTLIELIIVLGILLIISTIVSLNSSKFKNIVSKIEVESSRNEVRSLISFGKSYCRKNRVNGSITVYENNLNFNVVEPGYTITKEAISVEGLKFTSNVKENDFKIDKEGYIKTAGTIVIKSGKYYSEITIGVGNDIIGVKEVDTIEW